MKNETYSKFIVIVSHWKYFNFSPRITYIGESPLVTVDIILADNTNVLFLTLEQVSKISGCKSKLHAVKRENEKRTILTDDNYHNLLQHFTCYIVCCARFIVLGGN